MKGETFYALSHSAWQQKSEEKECYVVILICSYTKAYFKIKRLKIKRNLNMNSF